MKCPFCNKEVAESTVFCPYCGQTISQTSSSSASFNSYWKDNNDAAQKVNSKQKAQAAQIASDKNKRRSATIFRFIFVCAVICAIILFVVVKNANNQKALEVAHESMIGEQYEDWKDPYWDWVESSSAERRVVTITDDDTLEFVEGDYSSYKNDQGIISWEEKEIYKTDTFSYELSISFWGEVTIHFSGEEFEVYINEDDGSVRWIKLY